MKKAFLLVFVLMAILSTAQIKVQGILLDSATHEPLPFVNIAVKGTTTGTSTSLSGKFELTISSLPSQLIFSYVGYEKKEVSVKTASYLKIYLKGSGIDLGEAVVLSGPNPALELMKKVIRYSEKNNPEGNGSFSYTSYNKMIFTIDYDSVKLAGKKTGMSEKEQKETFGFFEKQHLFMSECISEKKYLDKNHQKETILASKVSGFATPVFSLISTQFQSFHFYTEEVSLGDVKYVGPVSKHGLNFYHYILQDTFLLENDTVYAISFSPFNENSSQSMKGILQIHTDGYAIYNVIAEPFKPSDNGFGIKISQQYRKINDQQWFPEELNTELLLNGAKIGEFPVIGIGTGKLSDIRWNPEFSKKDFDELEVSFDTEISKSEEKLQKLRTDSLTQKEKETYRVIDSLGQKHQFDKKMLAMQSIFSGYVPIKFLDWDIAQLMNYNDYEGFRLALGLRTNHKISKHFSLGGYLGYGFTDKAWKYGTDVQVILSKRKQIEFNFSLKQDIEAASIVNSFEKQRYLLASGYSNLFLNRFDSVLKYEARFSFRALRHFKFTFFGNHQTRQAYKDYQYVFPLSENIDLLDESYTLAETGIEMKMAIHEKFVETPFGFLSTGTSWPLLTFRFTKGIKGFYGSEYEYERFTLKADYSLKSLRAGKLFLSATSGITQGNAPYHLLFNPTGTYKPIQKLTVYSIDGFETMRLNEFLYDRFASLHIRYQLPWPIVNGKKFKPLLSLTNSMVYGEFQNATNHQNLTFSMGDKIFTESGIVIDNLLKSGVSGIGIGLFYRWGAYQLPLLQDNIALKISLSLALS